MNQERKLFITYTYLYIHSLYNYKENEVDVRKGNLSPKLIYHVKVFCKRNRETIMMHLLIAFIPFQFVYHLKICFEFIYKYSMNDLCYYNLASVMFVDHLWQTLLCLFSISAILVDHLSHQSFFLSLYHITPNNKGLGHLNLWGKFLGQ